MDDFDYNDKEFIEYINSNNVYVFGAIANIDTHTFREMVCVAHTVDGKDIALSTSVFDNIISSYKTYKRDNVINTVLDDTI